MIKAVLFDIDGVLVESLDANLQFYQKLFITAGYRVISLEEFLPMIPFTMEEVIKNFTQESDKEVRRIWEIGAKLTYPYHLLTLQTLGKETIQQLSKKYRLGIVTNRIKKGIDAILQETKLQKYFQVAVGIEDTKNHKPHPEPLLFAAQKLSLKPEEIVYIGDAKSDIVAGKEARMKVILFGKEKFTEVDGFTSEFKYLPDIIAGL